MNVKWRIVKCRLFMSFREESGTRLTADKLNLHDTKIF